MLKFMELQYKKTGGKLWEVTEICQLFTFSLMLYMFIQWFILQIKYARQAPTCILYLVYIN